MKKTIKTTRIMTLILATLTLTLVGCGTGADSAGMGAQSTISQNLLK